MSAKTYALRTVASDGTSYGGFRWPLEVGATVTCPDWDPTPQCGGGLHGLLWGEGDGTLLHWSKNARWLVIEVPDDGVDLGLKRKWPSAVVAHVGDQESATSWIIEHGGAGRAVVGGTATAGHRGTATAGYGGTATAGYGGTATAGYGGTATAGYGGIATAGHYGTATAGYGGTAPAGYGGTATAGYGGTATAGYGGTATAGYGGIVQVTWIDASRVRIATGYVGENGIEANVPYRCDGAGRLVRLDQ